jgi:hexosaminidase
MRSGDSIFQLDTPVFEKRAVHFDLKGLPPNPDRLLEWLHIAAAARYNVVLVEWEDTFPWAFDERVRGKLCYTPETIREFHKTADTLGIEVIPLVQSLGHMEMILRHTGYEHLREVPTRGDAISPLAPGGRELILSMIDEVLELTPNLQHFHLGGDEAWCFGSHPDTKAFIEKHGKAELFLNHYRPLLDHLISRGIRPILWHDMMHKWDTDALRDIGGKADLMAWGYQGHPDTTDTHFATRYLERFVEAGVSVWGSTAFRGGDGFDLDVPDPTARRDNAEGWVTVGSRLGFKGIIATGWSRYCSDGIQCYPFEAALDMLAMQGVLLHDGQAPADCLSVLGNTKGATYFEQMQPILNKFQYHRGVVWNLARQIRTHRATPEVDPRRDTHWLGTHLLANMDTQLKLLKPIAAEVIKLLETSTTLDFAQQYVQERMVPLEQERACLPNGG